MIKRLPACKTFFLTLIFFAVLMLGPGVGKVGWGQTQTFTSSGSFTVPAGVTSVKIEAWGSGAGGNNTTTNGGGGGAFASTNSITVTPGATISVSVGAGGAAGANGQNSSFGTFVIAAGANAAVGGLTTNCTGSILFAGGNGGTSTGRGGAGGGGSAGAGGNGGNGGNTDNNNGGVAGTAGVAGSGSAGANGGAGGSRYNNGTNGSSPGGGGGERGNNGSYSGSGGNGRVIISWITVSATPTETCIGGSTGTITVSASGGDTPYSYQLNSGTPQSGNLFTGQAAGTYTITVTDAIGRSSFTSVTVNTPAASGDIQTTAGSNTWIGHVYDGTNFANYIGHYNETETFDQNFGGDYVCFTVTSNSLTRAIYTETFSVRYRMNSTKKGLYIADLGSDDGSLLTVDGTLLYNEWGDHGFNSRPRVLMNLNGASSLVYDFYENGGGNRVVFQNLVLVLANTLNTNTIQNICVGNTGSAISGDTYGALPTGITLSGTGYQWSYSNTPAGARTNITGATGASFTPDAAVAPFNVSGTYYIFRNAVLSSTNNVAPNPYLATNESNVATITVNPLLAASISISASATTICAGTSVTFTAIPINGGTTPAYQWKVNGANVGTNSATYTNAALANGNTVTCLLTSNATCATGSPATSNTATITVNPNLPVSISIAPSANPVCSGTSVTFTATPTNGGTTPAYQWKVNGVNVGTNSTTYTNAAFTNGNTVTCLLTSNATCATGSPATSNTVTMTVNPLPVAAGIISGTAAICQGSSQIYSVTNVAGVTYTWAFPAGWTQTGGGTTNSITVTVGATSGNVQVTPSNTCGTGIAQTLATTVSTSVPGAAGTIAGTASVYQGQTGVAYSVGAIIGATSYSWSYSGTGATINGTTNSVTINFGGAATAGNLTVRGTNSCGNGTVSANYAITVTAPPCITSQPSNVTVCPGNTTSFSIATTGTGYQWQRSTDNGVNWTNITAAGTNPTYAGYNSSKTLTLTNVVAANNGYQYRCIVSNGCPATSNAATLNVGMDIYSPRLSANPDLIDPPATSSIISLTNTQLGLRYQLMANKSTVVGSPVIGTGGSIDFAVVTPSSSTNYTVIATSISSACKDTINDKKTIIVNEDGLIIDLHPCAGQPGSNFFTNSEFGTTTSNYYSTPDPVNNPGVIFGNPLGAYTNYTFGFVGGEIPDGNYVIANSTAGMYRQPPAGDNNIWLLTNDRSAPLVIPPAVGTGHMYIINAAYAPGTFYSETLTGLCDSTKYEFSAEMINLYAGNWVPYGTASLDYFPTDDQGNKYSVLPNIDFMINGKIAFNTGNIMNDGSWHTFGFTFRTGGLSSIALTMRNNAPGGIGNDIALDNIVIRACGPQISLNIITTLPVCPGTPVMMTAQIIASDYITPVYQWQISTDGGVNWSNISGANSTSYTENSPISGHKYRFITGETIPSLTNPNCHVASNPVTILTTADILTTTPATSCNTGIVTLGATANSGSTIKWYDSPTGGTLLKTQATPSTYITPPLSNTITYYVDATQSGCTSSPRIPIVATIYPGTVTASVSISANPGTNLCTGNSVTFTATPTNGGMAPLYQWKKNGTNITAATTSIYTTNTLVNNDVITCVMTENPDNVCITGSPATPISNPLTMTVASMAASISIAASPGNTICNGISVTFTATPTNGGAIPTYQWKLNGSNISGATNSTYTTTTLANNNQIACVMTSSFICATGNPATSNIVTMTVNPNPIVSVGGAMAAICQGGTSAALGGSFGGGATAAIWSAPSGTFTNNTGSTPGTATFTAVANSTTPITLTLTTSGGSCGTTSANKNIVVNPNPTVNVGGAMASICQGGTSAALGGSFGGGATAAIWSAPSGTFTNNTGSTPNTATFTAAANSTTPITLTLTTSGGSCSTTSANKQIVVNPNLPASVSIAASATTICAGTSVTFTATPTNGGPTPSYQWKVGATNVGTNSTTYTDAALTNGASVTCVMISNASPCSTGSPATSSAITMTVNPLLPASVSISAVPSGAICAGTSVTFTATPTNGGTPAYQWYNGASLIAGATNPTYTSAALANGASITVQMTSNASCATGSPATSNAITMTVNPTVGIPVFTLGATSTRCQGAGSVTYTATATNTTGITYSLDAASVTGGNSIVAVTGAVIYVAGWSGTSIITASAAGCNGPSTATHTVTETPTVGIPVFTLGATSTRCQGAGSVTYTATATNTTGITYTLDAASVTGGNSIVAGTGAVTYVAGWSGTSIITASAVGCNGPSIAIHTVTIIGDLIWTGTVSTDWNVTGNWTCGAIPDLTRNVQIPNVTNKPILSTGAAGTAKNIVIDNLSSLTIIGNTMQIAGSITNSGTFTATAGTIEMKGAVAQFIGAGVFAGNTIMNLTVNNPIGVTLQGPLNITGIVTAVIGNLSSGGNLTLLSSAAQTALIDGTGTGTVTGNVTMQRYLPSAFGYKYFSSPFQAATVNEFADDMDLAATFPTFYKYDEENHRDSSGVNLYSSGWVKYLAGNLSPMSSYAVNFGSALPAKTVNITGVVNNSSLNVSLVNNNRKYTKGFNLIGNPYPSPVDWDIPGWTKTNIDDAIYFFNAGNTDQYTGLYSSYVGGVSTGNGDNLIASMQGFFVHVSDGTYPVSALLGVTNPVRTNDLNPLFKVANIDDRTILRFAAHFETENAIEDAAVIYFDDNAHRSFDKDMDALKLLNTDVLVPNLYTLSTDSKQLSINGMPFPADSITKIPLGITTLSDGWINFKANDISQLPSNMHIYLLDAEKGVTQDLKQQPAYRFHLKTGEYNQRFTLVFSLSDINDPTTLHEKMFAISRSADRLLVKINLPFNTKGNLSLTNMAGQNIIRRDVFEKETIEINPDLIIGVYIVTVISGKRIESEKILMRKDYE